MIRSHNMSSVYSILAPMSLFLAIYLPSASKNLDSTSHNTSILSSQDQQDILQELPFSKGFIDSLWSPNDVKFIDAHTFLVVDKSANTVWLIQGDGMNVRSVGREGNGPGEFQDPVFLAIDSNCFYVWDRRSHRMSSFSHSGELIDTKSHQAIECGSYSGRMGMAGWGDVAIAPNSSQKTYSLFGKIVLLSPSLERLGDLNITRQESEAIIEGWPFEAANNAISIGKGSIKTLLVGYHNDYTIRRYSSTGRIQWDSGSLDLSFKPMESEPFRLGGGYAVRIMRHNDFSGLWEIEGMGILIGLRKRVGEVDERTIYDTFLDVITPSDGIIKRIPIPGRLLVRDVWISDEEVRLLTMLTGGGELPRFAFFKIPIDNLFQ